MLKKKNKKKNQHKMNFTNTQPNDKLKGINKNEKMREIMIPKIKRNNI